MKKTVFSGLIMAFCLTFLACAPKHQPFERNNFILEIQRTGTKHQEAVPGTLAVREFSVSPGFQGREIVYRLDENKAVKDFYNHYFILPGPMISSLARSWLRDAEIFTAVIPLSSHKNADFILEGSINSIYGDFQKGLTPRAVLDMDFLLLHDNGMEYQVMFHSNYRSEINLSSSGARGLINGLNLCLEDIFVRLENDLASAL